VLTESEKDIEWAAHLATKRSRGDLRNGRK
jgi:hypothetical protein